PPPRPPNSPPTPPRSPALPPPACAKRPQKTTPELPPRPSPAGSTPPDYPTHPTGHAHPHRANQLTTPAASDWRSRLLPQISSHRHQHPPQPLDERFDARRIENVGVVFDAKDQFAPPLDLHGKWVVVVFASGDLGDGQLVVASQRGGVDRVVFEHEKGVEQLVLTGDPVDLG